MDRANDDNLTSRFLQDWHKGDRAGMEKLLERHLPWIQSYVHRKLSSLLRGKAETGDIVQDAVVQFLRFGPRFQLSSDRQFRALLSTIIQNVLRDKYDWFTAQRRSVARERPLPADTVLNLDARAEPVSTPSQIVHKHEQEAWVRLGLELLEPQSRQVLVLHDWEGLTFVQIGEAMEISKDAARRQYLASLAKLTEKVRLLRSGNLEQLVDPGLT